jgi:hypothetical protein
MVNAKQRLFDNLWLDYIGPFQCRMTKTEKRKIYIIIFKCAWSRNINLEIVTSGDTKSFLQGFQNHVYEFGLPSYVTTDAACNLSAGFNYITDILRTGNLKDYFSEHNISPPEFIQIPRGGLNRGLPGFIETSVKQVKKLLQGSIKNNILDIMQFYHIVKQCQCLANKRPLNNLHALRDQDVNSTYRILTPEVLKLGYETSIFEINSPIEDLDSWSPNDLVDSKIAFSNIKQLIKIKNDVRKFYHDEFLYSLMDQATRTKGKYIPVHHQIIENGDVCMIKDPFIKPAQMPLGLIIKTYKNSNNETVKADIKKANKSIITRDVTDLVLLVRGESPNTDTFVDDLTDGLSQVDNSASSVVNNDSLPTHRKARIKGERKTKDMFASGVC